MNKEEVKNKAAKANNFDSFDRAITYIFGRQLTNSEYVFLNILIDAAMEEYRNQPTPFTPIRTPQEEAERLFHWVCLNTVSDKHDILVVLCEFINYTISALQLRGLSTSYEEEVLTILKGM